MIYFLWDWFFWTKWCGEDHKSRLIFLVRYFYQVKMVWDLGTDIFPISAKSSLFTSSLIRTFAIAHMITKSYKIYLGKNFKIVCNRRLQKPQKLFLQSVNIVDISNILGKNVHGVKIWKKSYLRQCFFCCCKKYVSYKHFLNFCPSAFIDDYHDLTMI